MSDTTSLDVLSYVAMTAGGDDSGSYITMPAHPSGIVANDDPALMPAFLVGNGAFEGVNWYRGLWQPAVQWSGIPHREWFTAANLNRMFGCQGAGRSSTTGLLPTAGALAYRVGSGVGADEITGNFTKCWAAGLTLAGGGQGSPVSAAMGLLGAGAISGTALGSHTYDTTAMTAAPNGCFLSDGVTFGGALTQVLGWTLTIANGLTPDVVAPGSTAPNSSTKLLVPQYLNGPLGVGLTIFQRAGATIVDSGTLSSPANVSIVLHSVEAGGTGTATVTLAFQGLQPSRSSRVQLAPTVVSRTYVGQATLTGGTFASKLTIS